MQARIWLALILIILAVWLFVYGGANKIPALNGSAGGFNSWFIGVTGISFYTLIIAIWRLIWWLAKFIFQLITQIAVFAFNSVHR